MPATSTESPAEGVGLSREELEAALVEHSGIIWQYVHRFHRLNPRMELDDLYQEAVGAMIRAARTYDRRRVNPETGKPYTFCFYGGYNVYSRLQTYLEVFNRQGMNGKTGDYRSIKAEVALPRVHSLEAIRADRRSREPNELGRVEATEPDLAGFWRSVGEVLATRPRHLQLVRWYYCDGLRLTRIAELMRLTKVRVGRMRDEALALLRDRLSDRWLEELRDDR